MEKKPYELQSEEEKKAHYDSEIAKMMEGYETITIDDEDEAEEDSPAEAEPETENEARKTVKKTSLKKEGSKRKKKEEKESEGKTQMTNIKLSKETHRSLVMLQMCLKVDGKSYSQSDIIDALLTKKLVKSAFGDAVAEMFEKMN